MAESIVEYRNELVHETMLRGESPTADQSDLMHATTYLQRLNDRLVLRLCDVDCGFVGTPWNQLGQFLLDLRHPE